MLDKCGEDEIESLSFMAPDIGIYLLSEVLFNAIQPFIMRNCMLERIDIVVKPQDRSSYLVRPMFLLLLNGEFYLPKQ